MVSFPPCKINLGLNIISKRDDGFHNILTCFYPVPWHDILEIIPAKVSTFSVSGLAIPGAAKDNLCLKAYEMLKHDQDLPEVAIHLHKIVPVGAGLGGGSADAAHTLKTLNELFDLGLTMAALREYASRLGSDCAFFIEEKPMMGSERGEVLSDIALTLKGKFLVIVKPQVQIPTAEAYSRIVPHPESELRVILEDHPLHAWKGLVKNDFEDSLFSLFPVIEAIQQKLYALGALYASVSGSGSAVFGIFSRSVDIKKEFESFTYWAGALN